MSSQMRNIYTLYLSLLPVVSVYRMPGLSFSLSTVLTLILMVYAVQELIKRKMEVPKGVLFPFVIYVVYVIVKSDITFSILCIALLIHILAICTGIINERKFRDIIELISAIAAFCVIFQQIIHIALGIHIPLYLETLFIGELKEQYYIALTSSTIDGLYRPSAFFLEPAHFSQYCIIGLGSTLFRKRPLFNKAFLISTGILATTSGIGLFVTFGMWGWWYVTLRGMNAKKFILLVILSLLFIFILNNIDFTHKIINRVISDPDSGEYNAIKGRLWWWDTYFGNFSFYTFLSGFGLDKLPENVYFTGFMKQLFCYGIIGTTCLLLFLVQLFLKSNSYGKACIAVYIILLFFADITSYVSLLFYIGTFLTLYIYSGKIKHKSVLYKVKS